MRIASYVRFENAVIILDDCLENLHNPCSEDEARHRRRLIDLARQIVEETDGEDTEEDEG
jgi:hypothetical protein